MQPQQPGYNSSRVYLELLADLPWQNTSEELELDLKAAKEMEELIISKKQEGDSVGGIVETIAVGVPAGLGEPVFGRLDGDLARILLNIGAVNGSTSSSL